VRLLIAGYTFHCWELLGMWSWTPAFFAAVIAISGSNFGETVHFGAYLVASMHLVGALASVTMGRLADLLGRRVVLAQVAAIGDSPVLSTALTEMVEPGHLGSILAVRSLLGFGAGGIAPLVFGAILDLTNPPNTAPETWGWAFTILGLGGLCATLSAILYKEPGIPS